MSSTGGKTYLEASKGERGGHIGRLMQDSMVSRGNGNILAAPSEGPGILASATVAVALTSTRQSNKQLSADSVEEHSIKR